MRLFLVLCIVALGSFSCKEESTTQPDPTPKEGTQVGNLAPSFTLPDQFGKEVRLKNYRGKVVLLEFWNSQCHVCNEEMPDLERLWYEHKDSGKLVVIGISGDEFEVLWRQYIASTETGSGYPRDWIQVWNTLWDVAGKFNVGGTPHRILINREGIIVDNYVTADEMETLVEAELAKQ